MKRFTTRGIVLSRTDFEEAARIITFLTPDHGKIRTMAKGVRKSHSKLAGGIELFSISDLTVLAGRGEIDTLMSSRMHKHYGNIVKDIERTNVGYETIKMTNKATEDAPEPAYFELLELAFAALDDLELEPQLAFLWFNMQLLKLSGHEPNLQTDITGAKLISTATYEFHLDRMRFSPKKSPQGVFTANHIKFLRLGFAARKPEVLSKVQGTKQIVDVTQPLVRTMLQSFVRI